MSEQFPANKVPAALRAVRLGSGVPSIPLMQQELQDMTDVLMGRVSSPFLNGTLSLMECADAFYARASELTMLLQEAESDGRILKSSAHYRLRTGALRTFREMAQKAAELGSRRLTEDSLLFEKAKYGRESRG